MKIRELLNESFITMPMTHIENIMKLATQKGKEAYRNIRWGDDRGTGAIPMFKVEIKMGVKFPGQSEWKYVDLTQDEK